MAKAEHNKYFKNIIGSVVIGIVFTCLLIYFFGAEVFHTWEKLPSTFIDLSIVTILMSKCISFIGWYLALNNKEKELPYYQVLVYGYALTIAASILMLDYMVYPNYNVSVLFTLIVPFGWFLSNEKGIAKATLLSALLCLVGYVYIQKVETFEIFFFNRLSSLVVIAMVGIFLKYFKINKLKLYKTNAILNHKIIETELKSKELEQYLYTVSHDLKEPLRSLSLILEIFIKNNNSKIGSEDLELLSLVKGSTLKMGKSIEAILDYSKLGQNFNIENVDIAKVINDAIFKINNEYNDENLKFDIKELGSLDVYLEDFQRLVEHLISNAIIYRNENRVCNISISRKDTEQSAIFYFKDNGIGIEKVNHERIFKIFQTLKANENRKGIGLAHCCKIVELHKGKISVDSEIGKGSTFIVEIAKNLF